MSTKHLFSCLAIGIIFGLSVQAKPSISPRFLGIGTLTTGTMSTASSIATGSCTLGSDVILCDVGSSTILGNIFVDQGGDCLFDSIDCAEFDTLGLYSVSALNLNTLVVYPGIINSYGAYYICADSGLYDIELLTTDTTLIPCVGSNVINNVYVNGTSVGNDFPLVYAPFIPPGVLPTVAERPQSSSSQDIFVPLFDLYPVPVSSRMNVRPSVAGDYSIAITSVTGRIILEENFQSETMLCTEGLESGMYIYTIVDRSTGFTTTGRFIKR